MLAVFIHDVSDLFNAWGTGFLEPFSSIRITFGTIPIVDLVFWILIGVGFLLKKVKGYSAGVTFKWVWALIALHVGIQSAQGAFLYAEAKQTYEQVELSASFIPWHFSMVGKDGSKVEILEARWASMILVFIGMVNHSSMNPSQKNRAEISPLCPFTDKFAHSAI